MKMEITTEDAKHILFSKGNVFAKKSGKVQAVCKDIRDQAAYDPRMMDEARKQIFEARKQLDALSDLIDRIEEAEQPSLFNPDDLIQKGPELDFDEE
mgnify:CR=1 FL=1